MSSSVSSNPPPLIDIGCNLTDPMFRGTYRGKQQHPDDFDAVLQRGWSAGVEKVVITAGSLTDARAAIALVRLEIGWSDLKLQASLWSIYL